MTRSADRPAFPTAGYQPGMTLRQWYAGILAAGMRATESGKLYPKEMIATLALADADALLEAEAKDNSDV